MKPQSFHPARFVLLLILAKITLGLLNPSVSGQAPVIESFSQNGELTCTNLLPGSVATVLEAETVSGPWTTNATSIPVTANGTFQLSGLVSITGAKYYQVRGEPKQPTVPSNMVLIPAGGFQMGDTFSEGYDDERPVHTVYISAFYMDQTEVTKAQWDEVYQWAIGHGYSFDRAGSGKAANHPVENVNWYDAVKWCNARSEREGRAWAYYTDSGLIQPYRTGQFFSPYVRWDGGYRLPTEAEWEKAARGGLSGKRFPWGDTITHSEANYWSYWESGHPVWPFDLNPTEGYHPTYATGLKPYTSPVGSFSANGYGLYDMAGNVREWCWDWHSSNYYSSSPGSDPRGPSSGSYRVLHDGGWRTYDAGCCRAASRGYIDPYDGGNYLGLRAVMSPGQP